LRVIGVIPAAGSAARLQPIAGSKEVLPVGGRPVMDYLVERMQLAGADDVVVVTRPEKEDVAAHARELGLRVVHGRPATASQSILLGLEGAARDDQALLGFPDTIWQPLDGFASLREQLVAGFEIALGIFSSAEPKRSDVVVLEGELVTAVDVKPARPRSSLVWGCAAARVGALGRLDRYEDPGYLFDELALAGRVAGVRLSGELIDIGTVEALERARAELNLHDGPSE
jgi:glucose-1-phosphate thymidylyltransferase